MIKQDNVIDFSFTPINTNWFTVWAKMLANPKLRKRNNFFSVCFLVPVLHTKYYMLNYVA